MSEKTVYSARCPICGRRTFNGSTEDEAIEKVKKHAREEHKKEARTIEVKKMKSLKKAFE